MAKQTKKLVYIDVKTILKDGNTKILLEDKDIFGLLTTHPKFDELKTSLENLELTEEGAQKEDGILILQKKLLETLQKAEVESKLSQDFFDTIQKGVLNFFQKEPILKNKAFNDLEQEAEILYFLEEKSALKAYLILKYFQSLSQPTSKKVFLFPDHKESSETSLFEYLSSLSKPSEQPESSFLVLSYATMKTSQNLLGAKEQAFVFLITIDLVNILLVETLFRGKFKSVCSLNLLTAALKFSEKPDRDVEVLGDPVKKVKITQDEESQVNGASKKPRRKMLGIFGKVDKIYRIVDKLYNDTADVEYTVVAEPTPKQWTTLEEELGPLPCRKKSIAIDYHALLEECKKNYFAALGDMYELPQNIPDENSKYRLMIEYLKQFDFICSKLKHQTTMDCFKIIELEKMSQVKNDEEKKTKRPIFTNNPLLVETFGKRSLNLTLMKTLSKSPKLKKILDEFRETHKDFENRKLTVPPSMVVENEKDVTQEVVYFVIKDLEVFFKKYQMSGSAIIKAEGAATHFISIIRDLSRAKEFLKEHYVALKLIQTNQKVLVQTIIPHFSVCYKIYYYCGTPFLQIRDSLPRKLIVAENNPWFSDLANLSADINGLSVQNLVFTQCFINQPFLQILGEAIGRVAGLTCFCVDLLVSEDTHDVFLIDFNDFPSFKDNSPLELNEALLNWVDKLKI